MAGKVTGAWWKVTAETTGFMTNVTCELTNDKPGSAPCLTLVIEYGTTLLNVTYISEPSELLKLKTGT